MKNLKLYEAYSPEDYEDEQSAEIGREIEYKDAEQLFTPVFVLEDEPAGGTLRGGQQPQFDVLMDKTPDHALWAVAVTDEQVGDEYKLHVEYSQDTPDDTLQDIDAVINFATDEFKAGRYSEGVDAWLEDENSALVKLVSPTDIDYVLEDIYDYLRPAHGSYLGKSRAGAFSKHAITSGEISKAKRAITILLKYKKKIESITVGGPGAV